MNDTELTNTEEERLRLLLHRAADTLSVVTPDVATLSSEPPAPKHASRLLPAAAAACAVIIVGAGLYILSGDQDQRIDTVPADTGEPDSPMRSGAGPWRLPAESSDIEVVEANEVSFPLQFGFVVDDPADPTRWAAVMSGSYDFNGREPSHTEVLSDGTVLSVYEPVASSITGATWMTVSSGPTGTGLANVAYRGLTDTEVVSAVQGAVTALPDASSIDRVPAILANLSPSIPRGGEVFQPFMDVRDSGAVGNGLGFQARVRAADGSVRDPVTVTMYDTGLPPAVAGLQDRLIVEASRAEGRFEPEVIDRPDLGPGGFTLNAEGIESPFVYDADGTSIRVSNDAMNVTSPANLEDQLRLISRLVPMTREEVEAELATRGISGLGTGTETATTTTYEIAPTTIPAGP